MEKLAGSQKRIKRNPRLSETENLAGDLERFLNKIKKMPSGCWEWQGGIDKYGYGIFSLLKKLRKAHRVSWEYNKGLIPQGLLVCHTCDNPPCVNPSHLWLGTVKDNSLDSVNKNRPPRGERNKASKLKEAEVLWIIKNYKKGSREFSIRSMAQKFEVAKNTIFLIVNKKKWKYLQ